MASLLLVPSAASAAEAKRFQMQTGFVLVALNNSPWAVGNGVRAPECRGIGKPRRDAAFQSTWSSFRCTVVDAAGGAARGVALV
ncbi:MAG TPA: hypothetical protein VLK58_18375 [Conexibacter sp.]|nr:hypothetical protein [Conexibacter sp.]